jgi:ABC-type antimicrobial peptide transport system permease subunit
MIMISLLMGIGTAIMVMVDIIIITITMGIIVGVGHGVTMMFERLLRCEIELDLDLFGPLRVGFIVDRCCTWAGLSIDLGSMIGPAFACFLYSAFHPEAPLGYIPARTCNI